MPYVDVRAARDKRLLVIADPQQDAYTALYLQEYGRLQSGGGVTVHDDRADPVVTLGFAFH